jgi:hypothetical protein
MVREGALRNDRKRRGWQKLALGDDRDVDLAAVRLADAEREE